MVYSILWVYLLGIIIFKVLEKTLTDVLQIICGVNSLNMKRFEVYDTFCQYILEKTWYLSSLSIPWVIPYGDNHL